MAYYQTDLKTSVCPACQGSGLKDGSPCLACHGIGLATEYRGETYFWGARLDEFGLGLRKLQKTTEAIINLTGLILAVGLLVTFGIGAYLQGFEIFLKWKTWVAPSWFAASFWAALIVICFTVYRALRLTEKIRKIPARSFEESTVSTNVINPAAIDLKKSQDISRSFAPDGYQVLESAFSIARDTQSGSITPAHLFAAAMTTTNVAILAWRLGLGLEAMSADLRKLFAAAPKRERLMLTPESYQILLGAYFRAYHFRRPFVGSVDLFLEAVGQNKELQDALFNAGVDLEKLGNAAAWIRMNEELREWRQRFAAAAAEKPTGPVNRAMTSIATPLLDRYSEDLTRQAVYGRLPMLVGREREMNELLSIMESGRQSVVLVGGHGVGRAALINGLAIRMVLEDVPAILADKRLVSVSIPKLVAGVAPAQAEQVLLSLLGEVAAAGNIILALDNIHVMVGAGAAGGVDLAETFAEELRRGYFLAVATSTPDEYGKLLERGTLGGQLQKITVDEMNLNDAIQVVEAKAGGIEYEQGVFLSYGAVEAAVKLTSRYMHDQPLPGKAVDVIREAALQVKKIKGAKALVSTDDVAAIVSTKSNVPVTQVTAEESQKLLDLETQIAKRVIGQVEAVKAVSAALRRARAELRSGKRPIGSFLFLGPTGVGKTELSKAVAATFFGSEKNMIRLDMSEYQDPKSVERLLGVPGSGVGGLLTEAVRKNPFSLVLFDELEKAHPDILNLFLQVMDDGRLTDVTGRTVDFTNAIIIMTSNAGTQFIQDEVTKGTAVEEIRKRLLNEQLKALYRPEFLNRFDEIIVFKPLTLPEVTKIAEILVLEVANRLEEKGIYFESTEAAIADLAKRGFDPLFGARPLRRLIQDTVENSMAGLLLKNEVARGDTVIFDVGGVLKVEKKK